MFIYENGEKYIDIDIDIDTEGDQRLPVIAAALAQYMQNAQRVAWTLRAERAIRRICTSPPKRG